MTPAIFLDKDGTLIPDVPYNVDPALISLAIGTREAAEAWVAAGYKLVVVSNQSGVARGLFEEAALQDVRRRLAELLGEDAPIAGFYYCPHAPDEGCTCRKPAPGLLLRAAEELDIDLGQSWMIGDILNDIEAGRKAGCRTILIDNGNETEWLQGPDRMPHHRVANLPEAQRVIAAEERAAA